LLALDSCKQSFPSCQLVCGWCSKWRSDYFLPKRPYPPRSSGQLCTLGCQPVFVCAAAQASVGW